MNVIKADSRGRARWRHSEKALEALATLAASGSEPALPEIENALNAFEHAVAGMDALDEETVAHFGGRLTLYRTLAAAIKRLSSEPLNTRQDRHRSLRPLTLDPLLR